MSPETVAAFIGAVFGGIATFIATILVYWWQSISKCRFAATVLLNDLESIKRYLEETEIIVNSKKPMNKEIEVNIRYSDNWQSFVAECSFLEKDDIDWLYRFYDEIYDYNFRFERPHPDDSTPFGVDPSPTYLTVRKSDKRIRNMMFGKDAERYEQLTDRLRKKAKK